MKNIYIISILFLSVVFAQVSMSDLNKIRNDQLDLIKSELQSSSKANKAESIDLKGSNEAGPVLIKSSAVPIAKENYFGYNYFRKDISFYDNIPTPADYRLGPGDEIIISLWGESNSREKMTINKDGMIYYENIGFINLSNKTLKSAELLLIEELSRIYSTLKDKENSTKLMLELGKLKSINIYFSGHVENPGINLVHPFSDIFTAIIQAGGINSQGSLREVQLIRNEKIITKVDFYSFFMNGKNTFSNIKLIDGDVIHVSSVNKRVSISGEVNRPSTYELIADESVSDLIIYSSGFTSKASSTLILDQIIPVNKRTSDDNARTSRSINFKNNESITLNNGDKVKVPSISGVDSKVTVYGRVKFPGNYPGVNTTLKNVLDIAGGFDDPVYRMTIREDDIKILRQDSNQFYATELTTSYSEADKLQLLPNDKIFVYENINYRNSFTYRIEGEVYKPGTYSFKEGITIADAIERAEGLTSLSSYSNIVLFQEYTELSENDKTITKSKSVSDVHKDFLIGPNSIIKALPLENVIKVEGNVYDPGLVAFSRGLTLSKAIELAGGYKPYSMKKRTYIKRANGEVEKAKFFRGRLKRLYPGDSVFVPINPNPSSDFDISTFIAELSTTLANLAAILLIVDNQTN